MFQDLSSFRQDFPMLRKTMHGHPLVYLDSGATTHKPQEVIDAVTSFYQDHYATVLRAIYEIAEEANTLYQGARSKVQRFLNAAKVEEIVFTRSTTDAINLVAYAYGKAFCKANDVILISEMEHHSNLVSWQIMCEDRGAKLVVCPVNEAGDIDLDVFADFLKKHRPKLVAITHVSNVLGTINPIRKIADLVHAEGAHLLVDGAQAVAHMPVDVQELDADFYVFSGHKLYGPTGIGVLYGKYDLLEQLPPAQGGGAMVDMVTLEKTTYQPAPWKFEAGTMMLAEVVGLGQAIDYVQKIGLAHIHLWEEKLLVDALAQMKAIEGVQIIGYPEHRASVISFVVEGVHALDIGTLLDLKGIAIRTGHHCVQPFFRHRHIASAARISLGLYNNKDDIDAFITALKAVLSTLR